MNKFVSCGKCNNGYIEEEGIVRKCPCLLEYQRNEYLKILIQKSNLPISISNYSIQSYIGEDNNSNIKNLKKFIDVFQDKSNVSFYFYGKSGTQKTTIAQWVLLSILKKEFTGEFVNFGDLVNKLQKAERDAEIFNYIESLLDMDILIIDDSFDSKKCTIFSTGWQNSFIDRFFRVRLESKEKSCIFTSNIDYNLNWDSKFSDDLKALIKRNTIFLQFSDHIDIQKKFNINDLWS